MTKKTEEKRWDAMIPSYEDTEGGGQKSDIQIVNQSDGSKLYPLDIRVRPAFSLDELAAGKVNKAKYTHYCLFDGVEFLHKNKESDKGTDEDIGRLLNFEIGNTIEYMLLSTIEFIEDSCQRELNQVLSFKDSEVGKGVASYLEGVEILVRSHFDNSPQLVDLMDMTKAVLHNPALSQIVKLIHFAGFQPNILVR